jgi:long-chain acyl-CoA synthetase
MPLPPGRRSALVAVPDVARRSQRRPGRITTGSPREANGHVTTPGRRTPAGGAAIEEDHVYLGDHARSTPDRAAVTMWPSGASATFGELYDRAVRLANLFRAAGLVPGDRVAVFSYNHLRYYEVVWAALTSGLYVVPVNAHSTADEAGWVIADSGAQALVVSASTAAVAGRLAPKTPDVRLRISLDGTVGDHVGIDEATAGQPATPTEPERLGTYMFYSSGTTGRPKGIKPTLPDAPASDGDVLQLAVQHQFQVDQASVYLSPAPLHHAAPLRVSTCAMGVGAHVVCLDRFDAEQALAAIERFGVTSSQWVPTMFVRMLKLPAEVRERYDRSSHRLAVHAAAPCPIWVKEQMIAWWGPIITEYYAGSENIGATFIDSEEWLAHKGSVGRANVGEIHICDASGAEVPTGQDGLVYFDADTVFEYHGDPEKTAGIRHPSQSWRTLGDIGHVDGEGYLYLSDRATFMIIAGGANIYPREIEDVLVQHPDVTDAAVIGEPDDDLGEVPLAIVQPAGAVDGVQAIDTAALEAELRTLMATRLARYKLPRRILFAAELPRGDDGKLRKQPLRERYARGGR